MAATYCSLAGLQVAISLKMLMAHEMGDGEDKLLRAGDEKGKEGEQSKENGAEKRCRIPGVTWYE